jgi:hypothetical protein
MMAARERNLAIVAARDTDYLTFREIGLRFNISTGRALQIYRFMRRQSSRTNDGDTIATSSLLPTRVINVLLRLHLPRTTTRQELKAWLESHDKNELLKAKNLGRTTLREMEAWAGIPSRPKPARKSVADLVLEAIYGTRGEPIPDDGRIDDRITIGEWRTAINAMAYPRRRVKR